MVREHVRPVQSPLPQQVSRPRRLPRWPPPGEPPERHHDPMLPRPQDGVAQAGNQFRCCGAVSYEVQITRIDWETMKCESGASAYCPLPCLHVGEVSDGNTPSRVGFTRHDSARSRRSCATDVHEGVGPISHAPTLVLPASPVPMPLSMCGTSRILRRRLGHSRRRNLQSPQSDRSNMPNPVPPRNIEDRRSNKWWSSSSRNEMFASPRPLAAFEVAVLESQLSIEFAQISIVTGSRAGKFFTATTTF